MIAQEALDCGFRGGNYPGLRIETWGTRCFGLLPRGGSCCSENLGQYPTFRNWQNEQASAVREDPFTPIATRASTFGVQRVKIVILTVSIDRAIAAEAFLRGAFGFLPKTSAAMELRLRVKNNAELVQYAMKEQMVASR